LAIGVTALFTALASQAKGLGSRAPCTLPPALAGKPWAVVADAADAVRVFEAAGAHGRRLLVLTGRWATLDQATTEGSPAAGEAERLTPDNAVFSAMKMGVARELSVAMPAPVLAQRLADIRAARGKGITLGEGFFTHPFHGFERRFSLPEALAAGDEPVLVLVEPSFFKAGVSERVDQLLAARGVRVELGLLAAADPAASREEVERAAALALALEAPSAGFEDAR
jgi:hypothetical protein